MQRKVMDYLACNISHRNALSHITGTPEQLPSLCRCILKIVSGFWSEVIAPGIKLVGVHGTSSVSLIFNLKQFREGAIITLSGSEFQESRTVILEKIVQL